MCAYHNWSWYVYTYSFIHKYIRKGVNDGISFVPMSLSVVLYYIRVSLIAWYNCADRMTLLVHLSSDCRSHYRNCWTIRIDYQPRNRLCECNDILTRWCNIDITACITSVSLTHWPLSDLNRISDQVNFKLNIMIGGRSISCALPLRWMPVDLTD